MSKRKHTIDAFFNRATQLHGAGRLPEAEQAIPPGILAASPAHADSRHMLGVLALQAGHAQGALAEIDQAIALRPAAAMFHVNRANALLALNRPDDAIAASRQALHHKRNAAEAMQTLGRALSDLGRAEEAVAAYRDGLRVNPGLRDLHSDLGLALHDASRPDEAADAFAEALRRAPGDTLSMGNLAGALKDLGRLAEAERIYRDILSRIRTTRPRISIWACCCCWPDGSRKPGPSGSGGFAPIPPSRGRSLSRPGRARPWRVAPC